MLLLRLSLGTRIYGVVRVDRKGAAGNFSKIPDSLFVRNPAIEWPRFSRYARPVVRILTPVSARQFFPRQHDRVMGEVRTSPGRTDQAANTSRAVPKRRNAQQPGTRPFAMVIITLVNGSKVSASAVEATAEVARSAVRQPKFVLTIRLAATDSRNDGGARVPLEQHAPTRLVRC